MANIKTYDLLQCSRLYPTINGSNNAAFSAYIDDTVTTNSDDKQSYTVKENIQSRFFAPTSADGTSNVKYSVTSISFNGLECMNTVSNLTVEEAENIYIEFPLYLGDPTGYDSNVATGVTISQSLSPTTFFERNFIDFIQGLFDTLEINAEIKNSHPDWWVVDGFDSMKNFMLETYSSDTLIITLTELYNGVSRELMYKVDGVGATAYINGVDVTLIPVAAAEQPQYGDVYSINSYATTASPIVVIDCCPVVTPFYASLVDGCCSTLSSDCDCSKLTFSDTSVYDNGLLGHDPSYFNHRVITMSRPDGTTYVWNTDGTVGDGVDVLISPQWDSNNMFSYVFTDSDQDGIYSVEICTHPDWQSGIYYDDSLNYIVYRSGVIYKQVVSSTSVDPATDTANDYWIEVAVGDDMGRYCSTTKIVILCISIMDCYESAVDESICAIKLNPCKDLCDNKALLKAMKLRVTLDAVEFAVGGKRWALAKEHIDLLKNICCCNG